MGDAKESKIQESLNHVHEEIDACVVCREFIPSLKKPTAMRRGGPGNVVIVGIAPGNQEYATSVAFSGQSGKKLDEWLINAGARPENPRNNIYFTSILKCQDSAGRFDDMAHRCRKFLNRQLEILRPTLVISLGQRPYEHLRFSDIPYAAALCQLQTAEEVLLSQFSFDYNLLPWPHPSGLNRQLNDDSIRRRLENSFQILKRYL